LFEILWCFVHNLLPLQHYIHRRDCQLEDPSQAFFYRLCFTALIPVICVLFILLFIAAQRKSRASTCCSRRRRSSSRVRQGRTEALGYTLVFSHQLLGAMFVALVFVYLDVSRSTLLALLCTRLGNTWQLQVLPAPTSFLIFIYLILDTINISSFFYLVYIVFITK